MTFDDGRRDASGSDRDAPLRQISPLANVVFGIYRLLFFIPDVEGQVRLKASWSVVSDDNDTAQKSEIVRITAQMTSMMYAAQVEAMSQAIAKLADTIARHAG